MSQLEHERGGIDRLMSNWLLFERACEAANKHDPLVRQKIASLETGYRIGRILVYKGALGQAPAGFSAATKCFCTEHEQRVANFAASILGVSAVAGDQLQMGVAYAPAYTIQGGTSDVMRNILGERVLGSPQRTAPKMNLNLDGKVALVTGSYRGTGAGIAETLGAEGAHVIVHGFTEDETEAVFEELIEKEIMVTRLEADFLALDNDEIESLLPPIDILINNYGTPKGSSWESTEFWKDEWEHNVLMAVKLCQVVIAGMSERGWGRILFMGTIGTENPGTHSPGYYGSKAALAPIVKSLARELKQTGITVNMLNPGMIATQEVKEMLKKKAERKGINADWSEIESWAATEFMPNLTGRLSTPQSIGDIAAFWLATLFFK